MYSTGFQNYLEITFWIVGGLEIQEYSFLDDDRVKYARIQYSDVMTYMMTDA